MPRVNICGNCKHWQRPKKIPLKNPGITKSTVRYACRRYPPVRIVYTFDFQMTDWPLTRYYWHCGEFLKK